MHLENLPHVHPRRHTQRVEHDVDRRPVGHVRHVFHRDNFRHHALVAVPAGHLVARLQAALDRHIHLDHLLHARRQFVALGELLLFRFERVGEFDARSRNAFLHAFELARGLFVGEPDVKPVVPRNTGQIIVGDFRTLDQPLRSAIGDFVVQQLLDPRERVVLHDAQLVVQVLAVRLEIVVDNLCGALVALDAFAREYLHVDHRPRDTRGHAQRRIFHVGGLLAENGTQQLFFRRELGLALRRHFTHEYVARLDLGADVHDARFVEARQLRFAQRADIAGNLFGAELGVARHDRQFLDMDRGVTVVGDDAFRDQNRILVVVAIPRHERHQHVLPERQLAHVGRRTIGDDVSLGDHIAAPNQRPLVDVGVLI